MRKVLIKLLIVLLAAAMLTGLAWGGKRYFDENYVVWNGDCYRRDTQTLDLSGKPVRELETVTAFSGLKRLDVRDAGVTPEQYTWLRQTLPECEILWELPFQGQYLSLDTCTLTVDTLSDEDVLLLDYLPGLFYVDARACRDYPQLLALQQRRPDCSVFYTVTAAGKEWNCAASGLELTDADPEELARTLPFLPRVRSVVLTGQPPELEDINMLQQAFPEISFSWRLEIDGQILEKTSTSLDFSGISLESAAEAERILSYFPDLETVDMRGCGLSDTDMMALARLYPNIFFLWEATIASVTVSTDAGEIDLSGCYVGDPAVVEAYLPFFPNLKKVVMCGCGISNEEMDALNSRYADIRFVWSVYMGSILLRTDSTYFMPTKWGVKVDDADLYNLRYCTDMICVDVGHMDITSCEWAAYMPKLKYLIVADTQVSDLTPLTGLENLIYLELFQTLVRDYSPLVTCTALEDLNLCYTYGDPEPISQMTWLKRLWWSGSWNARWVLPEKLPDTQLEFDSRSSTGEGWRESQNYYDMRDLLGMGYMVG